MPAPSIGIFYCLNKNIAGLPFDTQCVVTVFKNAQPFRIEVQDIWSGRTYVAKFSNDTVNGFVEYALKSDLWPQSSGTEITAGTDMQTITAPGHYYCTNNSTAVSLKNCPMSDAFTLVVYRAAGGSGENSYYIAQEYTSYLCNRRVIQTYNKDSKKWTTHEIQFKS